MVFLDAFPAKHRQMVGTIKVLHPLVVFVAQQAVDALLIFEIDVSENAVSFNYFVQDIEIKR